MNWLERKKLFIVWNRACRKARQQPDSVEQILERLNKALGILQHHDYYQAEKSLYQPTQWSCGCKDWEFRMSANRKYTGPCKHMVAEILLARTRTLKFEQSNFLALVTNPGEIKKAKLPVSFTGKIWVKGLG